MFFHVCVVWKTEKQKSKLRMCTLCILDKRGIKTKGKENCQ